MTKNYDRKPVPLIWLVVGAIIAVLFVWKCAEAGEIVQVNKQNNFVGGDSSRVIGLSNSLGDVDINDCVISKQKGNVIWSWQNYDYNLFCLAEYMDRVGKHDEAAVLRCRISVVAKAFPTDCKSSMKMTAMEPTETPQQKTLAKRVAQYDEDEEEREELYVAQQQEIAYVKEELANVQEQLEQKPAQVTREVVQPFLITKELADELRYEK